MPTDDTIQPNDQTDPNAADGLKPNDTVVAPTRTMASDAARADSIESERQSNTKAVLAEIEALEAALKEAATEIPQSNKTTPAKTDTKADEKDEGEAANKKTDQTKHIDEGNKDQKASETDVKEVKTESTKVKIESLENKPENKQSEQIQVEKTTNGTNDSNKKDEVDDNNKEGIVDDFGIVYLDQELMTSDDETDDENGTPSKTSTKDPKIGVLQDEIARIEKSKLAQIQKRSSFTKKETPIRKELETLDLKATSAREALEPFNNQVHQIEDRISRIEQEEKRADSPQEKHEIENRRWQLEDERHKIEQQKWDASRKLEEILTSQKEKQAELESILADAQSIDASIQHADNRIKELQLEIKLAELNHKKEELEQEWLELNNRKRELESSLEDTKTQEAIIEQQVDQLHTNTINTTDATVRREFEQERSRFKRHRHRKPPVLFAAF